VILSGMVSITSNGTAIPVTLGAQTIPSSISTSSSSIPATNDASPTNAAMAPSTPRSPQTSLIIAATASGAVVLLVCVVLGVWYLWATRKNRRKATGERRESREKDAWGHLNSVEEKSSNGIWLGKDSRNSIATSSRLNALHCPRSPVSQYIPGPDELQTISIHCPSESDTDSGTSWIISNFATGSLTPTSSRPRGSLTSIRGSFYEAQDELFSDIASSPIWAENPGIINHTTIDISEEPSN